MSGTPEGYAFVFVLPPNEMAPLQLWHDVMWFGWFRILSSVYYIVFFHQKGLWTPKWFINWSHTFLPQRCPLFSWYMHAPSPSPLRCLKGNGSLKLDGSCWSLNSISSRETKFLTYARSSIQFLWQNSFLFIHPHLSMQKYGKDISYSEVYWIPSGPKKIFQAWLEMKKIFCPTALHYYYQYLPFNVCYSLEDLEIRAWSPEWLISCSPANWFWTGVISNKCVEKSVTWVSRTRVGAGNSFCIYLYVRTESYWKETWSKQVS